MSAECFQGVDDKIALFKKLLAGRGVTPSETAFVGDDINDLECLKYAGLAFTVADGHEECKAIADYVTRRNGGNHAVREICDLILDARGASL